MIDICKFFELIQNENYCLVKKSPKFPNYKNGEDFDLFCLLPNKIIGKIITFINSGYPQCNLRISKVYDSQTHVDVLKEEILIIRFDIYAKLPKYSKVDIKPSLFEIIIENAVEETIICNDHSFIIRIPCLMDELIYRYIEFNEYYSMRSDKIKHLEYISDRINDTNKNQFFDRLYYYTALPLLQNKNEPRHRFNLFDFIIFIKLMVPNPIKKWVKKIKRIFS